MDQVGQERLSYVGCFDRSLLRVHGVSVGWLCLHHQSSTTTRIGPHLHGAIQCEAVRQLQYMVYFGNFGQHANPLRWLLAGQEQRTYVSTG